MKRDVSIRSALRQPVRTIILAALIGLAVFAIVSRWTEYMIVANETAELEDIYRPVGYLESFIDPGESVREGADIIAQSPYVRFEDRRRFAQGVTEQTGDLLARDFMLSTTNYFHDNILPSDIYFYGTLHEMAPFEFSSWGWGGATFQFLALVVTVDERVAGYNFHAPEGRRIRLLLSVDETVARMFMWSGEEIMQSLGYDELTGFPELELEVGGQYLFRGSYFHEKRIVDQQAVSSSMMRALDEEAGLWFLPASADIEQYPEVMAAIELLNINQRTLYVTTTKDMTAMPLILREGHEVFLESGRWLDHSDYLSANPAIVMHWQKALSHGLRLGDTIAIELRDMQHHFSLMIPFDYEGWRDYPTVKVDFEIVGLFGYGPAQYIQPTNSYIIRDVFIPDSVMPPEFGARQPGMPENHMWASSYSFVLDSPRGQAVIIEECQDALEALGLMLVFRDGSPEEFAAAVDAIILPLAVNLWVFTVAAALIIALTVFLYMRQGRRIFAILRALGCPAKYASRQCVNTALLFWLPAGVIGAVAAWNIALSNASETLHTLVADTPGVEVQAALSGLWLLGIGGGILAIIFIALKIGAYGIARRPVLELLQNSMGAPLRRSTKAELPPGNVPLFVLKDLPPPASETSFSPRNISKAEVRRIFLQITRTPVKTALTAGTALILVFSLGWMQHTMTAIEAELEHLYEITEVQVDIRPVSTLDLFEVPLVISAPYGNVISSNTVNVLESSDFIREAYLVSTTRIVHFLPAMPDGDFPYELRDEIRANEALLNEPDIVYAFNSMDRFMAENGPQAIGAGDIAYMFEDGEFVGVGDGKVRITYAPGFSSIDFGFPDQYRDAPIPVIVHESQLERWGVVPGDKAFVSNLAQRFGVDFTPVQVIGSYSGMVSREVPIGRLYEAILMPLSGAQTISGMTTSFSGATFFFDPAMTSDLSEFKAFVDNLLFNFGRAGRTLLRPFYNDGDLMRAAVPLEQNLFFLRVLYPITLALSFVIGAGLAVIIMMQNAKSAAILRALGITKNRVRTSVCAEILAVAVSGIILGVAAMPVFGIGMASGLYLIVGLYLGGVFIGAVAGAMVISSRPPITLLQVKE